MKILRIITAAAVMLASMPLAASVNAPRHFTIMCMGDSQTQGGDTFTSYTYPLWKMLRDAGYDFEFVGPNARTYDIGTIRHCGFGGRTAEFIASNVTDFYTHYPADIVLLHSGHNHFIEEKPVPGIITAYRTIISEVLRINPQAVILVAQVVESGKLPKYSYIPELNKAIKKLVRELDDSRVIPVNVNRNFDWHTCTIEDKVHSNAKGASLMAAEWFSALKTIMGKPLHSRTDFSLSNNTTWTESEFMNPPVESGMQCFFHWQSGHVDREALTGDLESLKELGFSGVTLFNVAEGMCDGPVKYMSPGWWDLYHYMQQECRRLNLDMGVVQGAGWGVSGGPWVTPDRGMQEVVWTEKQVEGPVMLDEKLEIPVPGLGIERDMQKDPEKNRRYFVDRGMLYGYYRDLAVFAFPTPAGELVGNPYHIEEWWAKAGLQTQKMQEYKADRRQAPAEEVVKMEDIMDISDCMDADGHLKWKAPAGNWTILRVGYQPVGVQNHPTPPEGRGLEIDKMAADGVDFYWDHSVTKDVGSEKSCVSKVFIDSYEAGHQNWTKGFETEFLARKGYDIRMYLPAITGRVLNSTEETERFLWDYRFVISSMINRNFYGRFAEKCHEHGVDFAVEPYGFMGNTNEFTTSYDADIYLGEFWARENASGFERFTDKLASSLAHQTGQSVVGAEAFTTSGRNVFSVHPREFKTQGDYYYCLGINQFWLHSYVHDPYGAEPGLTLGFYGPQFNRHNTWWAYSKPWLDYTARCQYMLQQGSPVNDILYFMGEDAPLRPMHREKLNPEVPDGYDYDFCAVEMLDSLKVKDHRLVLPSGAGYSVLVVKNIECMRPVILEKIASMVEQGALVCIHRPSFTPGLALCDIEEGRLKELNDRLFGHSDDCMSSSGHRYGDGYVYSGASVGEFLSGKGISPDFSVENFTRSESTQYPGDGIEYIHRRGETSDMYFISNQQEHSDASFDAVFNVSDRIPEFWDPSSGKVMPAGGYARTSDGRIRVNMHIEEAGSVFVVFRHPFEDAAVPVPEASSESSDLSEGWTMTLADGNGSFTLPVLSDLSLSDDPVLRYYSGSIVYEKTFEAPSVKKGFKCMLDLGRVEVITRVTLNGRELGTLWKYPYSLDITPYLQSGTNTLRVEVANLWVNALVGDSFLPDDADWTTETLSTAPGVCLSKIPDWVLNHSERPSRRKTFTSWKWNDMQEWALPASGLIGPVKLNYYH